MFIPKFSHSGEIPRLEDQSERQCVRGLGKNLMMRESGSERSSRKIRRSIHWPILRGFPTLDAKLLSSLTNCAEGGLGRQIATFKELQARENKPVKSRQVLLKYQAIYDLEDLMSVRLVNDDLKSFISKWDSVLAGMKKEPGQSVLEAYFHMAIKNFRPLNHDLALYDRAAEGTKEKAYDFPDCSCPRLPRTEAPRQDARRR